jgi:beta-mannosidase
MIQSMRENFPYCGGVMPWVFKRPWATVGIQVVDGLGQPSIPYYAIQNSYRPLEILWRMPWSVIAPEESLSLDFLVLNDLQEELRTCRMHLTIYRPDMTTEKEMTYELSDGEINHSFGVFTPTKRYTDTCFLISAQLLRGEKLLAETTYFVKCTSMLADADTYRTYRAEPTENLYFENGPWLKESISKALKTDLKYELVGTDDAGKYKCYDIKIENCSKVPAFPVTIHLKKDEIRHFESENFFLLSPKESRVIRITTDCKENLCASDIEVCAWNMGGESNDIN